MLDEEREGYNAFCNGLNKGHNPYHWSNETWWMVEAWDDGWDKARIDSNNE